MIPTKPAKYLWIALILTVLLAACGATPTEEPPAPAATNPPEALPTPTVAPTDTVIPAPPTEAASPTPCTDAAEFVSETIPDDTVFQPGETFTKTWRLKNTGTCTWTTAYAIAFDRGNGIIAPDTVPLTGDVFPGQEAALSVEMKAPETPGTYTSAWKLRNPAGTLFGTGADNNIFYVKIVVPKPTAYSPYPSNQCSTLGSAIQAAIGAPVQMLTVSFTDQRTAETGTACRLYASGDGNTFGMAGPTSAVFNVMQTQGWVQDNNYGAAGATGMTLGYRQGNALAIAGVSWKPSADANCPKNQPIGACVLTPQQKLFEVIIDIAVK